MEKFDSINLVRFLSDFYGINCDKFKIRKLSHNDVKELFPTIKRISFEELSKSLMEVYRGEIIMVYDCTGSVVPYVNPHLEITEDESYEDIYDESYIVDISNIDLSKLSKDELLKIRRALKYNGQHRDEMKVVKAIRDTKNHKAMAYKKEKRELKGDYFNGKY